MVLPFPRSFNAIGNMTRGLGMIPTPNRIKSYEIVILHFSHPKFSFMEDDQRRLASVDQAVLLFKGNNKHHDITNLFSSYIVASDDSSDIILYQFICSTRIFSDVHFGILPPSVDGREAQPTTPIRIFVVPTTTS